ncbi:Transposase and inactivated derivatives [Aneurinibacillus thermoaerophilus]|jgi:transposase|uniref:Transposase and inactivated derivatives n=3 Tax=Aneurinibacillus thermoaerophilus TaxID=143495 RepID=A0A1G8AFS8_ANETH|nr:transposase [Aneurinibacillus sp. XH2]AMA73524.1 transposase [Aneurinibacillus sp. XH2]SDH19812.1 Transposase and inactivated derivatives [Aneurinibacillus thermoaerophilus]
MAKKGQKFQHYTPELKAEAVRLYEEEGMSYQAVAERLEIRSNTQVKRWVKKYRNGEDFKDKRGESTAWRKGRPKTKFKSVEEELAYVKAERDYLKKRYPNLHKE